MKIKYIIFCLCLFFSTQGYSSCSFAGNWNGKCVQNDKSVDTKINISSDCVITSMTQTQYSLFNGVISPLTGDISLKERIPTAGVECQYIGIIKKMGQKADILFLGGHKTCTNASKKIEFECTLQK